MYVNIAKTIILEVHSCLKHKWVLFEVTISNKDQRNSREQCQKILTNTIENRSNLDQQTMDEQ